tara:strand:- start:10818 stop:11741 length:924 start_codon:yes stop_codon:yes gene_type:complete
MDPSILPVWIAYSSFNYNNPSNSILNVAFPSAIAYYFITIQPNNTNFEYSGHFLNGSDVYQSSLTVYNTRGNIDTSYDVIRGIEDFTLHVKNNDGSKYVIMRYYCNLNIYNLQDYIINLPSVKDRTTEQIIPLAAQSLRDIISNDLYTFFAKNETIKPTFSEFYYSTEFKGLFPDSTHYYLLARPGDGKLFKITGTFVQGKLYPYSDFITIQGIGTQTENGIPFYDLPRNYSIYVAKPDISDNDIKQYSQSNDTKILRWKSMQNIGVLFRIITYAKDGITTFNQTMSPDETRGNMTSGFYPIFERVI